MLGGILKFVSCLLGGKHYFVHCAAVNISCTILCPGKA